MCSTHKTLLTGQIYTEHQLYPRSDQSLEKTIKCMHKSVHAGRYNSNIIYISYVIFVQKTIAVELVKRSETKGQSLAQSWAPFEQALCQSAVSTLCGAEAKTFSIAMPNSASPSHYVWPFNSFACLLDMSLFSNSCNISSVLKNILLSPSQHWRCLLFIGFYLLVRN